MKKPAYWRSLCAVFVVFVCRAEVAQDASQAWVQQISAPQYFAVMVEDAARSAEWYRKVFGLSRTGGSKADDGSWQIENLRNEHLFVEIIRDDRAQVVSRARGFRKVGFQVPDVEVVAARVALAGGERPRISDFAEQNLRIIQIRDPDGNVIQMFSPLGGQKK